MRTLFIFLTGYCVAECVSHLVFYYGKSLPFTAFGQVVGVKFNTYALLFYAVLTLVFAALAWRYSRG